MDVIHVRLETKTFAEVAFHEVTDGHPVIDDAVYGEHDSEGVPVVAAQAWVVVGPEVQVLVDDSRQLQLGVDHELLRGVVAVGEHAFVGAPGRAEVRVGQISTIADSVELPEVLVAKRIRAELDLHELGTAAEAYFVMAAVGFVDSHQGDAGVQVDRRGCRSNVTEDAKRLVHQGCRDEGGTFDEATVEVLMLAHRHLGFATHLRSEIAPEMRVLLSVERRRH